MVPGFDGEACRQPATHRRFATGGASPRWQGTRRNAVRNGGLVKCHQVNVLKDFLIFSALAWARRIPNDPWRVSASLAMGRGSL